MITAEEGGVQVATTTGPSAERARADLTARAAGILLVLAAFWLPLLSGRVGNDRGSVKVWDLSASRWFVWVIVLLAIGSLVVDIIVGPSDRTAYVSAFAACALVAGPLLLALTAEVAAVWLSPDRLPSSLRRLAVGLDPQAGILLTALGGALLLVGTLGRTESVTNGVQRVAERALRRDGSAIGILLAALTLIGIAVGRYGSWVQVTSTFGDWDVPGWSLPWFGVLTLVLVLLGAASVLTYALRPRLGPAVLLVVVGWAVTFPAALAITASAIGTVSAPPWVREQLVEAERAVEDLEQRPELTLVPDEYRPNVDVPDDLEISVGVGAGALAVFGLGIALSTAGLAMGAAAATKEDVP